jgi:hypothetical protein
MSKSVESAVMTVLSAAQKGLFVSQIVTRSKRTEAAVRAALRALAQRGLVNQLDAKRNPKTNRLNSVWSL